MQPIVYSEKKRKPSVNIHHEMSLNDLSRTLNFSVEHLKECLDYLNHDSSKINPDSSISDAGLLGSLVSLCGYRFQFVKKPDSTKAKEISDVKRRRPPLPQDPNLIERPPIVTIMGHVDHGKTTLLDGLRKTRVVDEEFGGITQHIGAFTVQFDSSQFGRRKIVFIDTPGHAAFCAMRARGVRITDLVVLVVAADDGVMPQTVESLGHIRESEVPFIVAINKIDKSNADLKSTLDSLFKYGVQIEECGGDVVGVKISALKNKNIDQLLQAITTIADLLDLKGDPSGAAEGVVLESRIDQTHGSICTAIIERGTLKPGSFVVSGVTGARVRRLFNENRQTLQRTSLCEPVQIVGWANPPRSGDDIIEVDDKKTMESVIAFRRAAQAREKQEIDSEAAEIVRSEHLKRYREELKRKRETGRVFRKVTGLNHIVQQRSKPFLPIIVRADVIGSLEAIEDSFKTYVPVLVDLEVISSGIGTVTIGDVETASAVNASIYGFNVRVSADVQSLADRLNVPIKLNKIIYRLFDDIHKQLNELVVPVETENSIGEAVVQKVFQVDSGRKGISVAGCRCVAGSLKRHALYKVVRKNGEIVHRGQLSSMKHFKEDVASVEKGQECGLAFGAVDQFNFEVGDVLVAYQLVMVKNEVEWFVSGEFGNQ